MYGIYNIDCNHNIIIGQHTNMEQQQSKAVGAVPDFDVTFAYLNFRVKGFPVSDFQYGDGYTESQSLM